MSRARTVATVLVFLGAGSIPASAGASPRVGTSTNPPNILVIVTDDQRAVGSMGVMPKTAAWFGDGGTTFAPAFVTTPLCCPSRSSIFTGRYAHNHGVRTNSEATNLDQTTTMQRYLHDAGYLSAIYGKYLNSWDLTQDPPYFDHWSIISRVTAKAYYDGEWNVGGTLKTLHRYSTTYLGDRAEAFLKGPAEQEDGRPWFLYLATPAPHGPSTPEPKYQDAHVGPFPKNPAVEESDRSDKPAFVQAHDDTPNTMRVRRRNALRTLFSVDDMVDRVRQALVNLGEENDTLAFFVSDNGFHWAEHGLRGKSVAYTDSIQVPFFARWPGHVSAGATDPRVAANIDIAPTALAAAGIAPPSTTDGRSLFDVWSRPRILSEFWALDTHDPTTEPSDWASTRTATFQYVEYYDDTGAVTFREYYDLTNDPWQLVNLYADGDPLNDPNPAPLSAQLVTDRSCGGAACP